MKQPPLFSFYPLSYFLKGFYQKSGQKAIIKLHKIILFFYAICTIPSDSLQNAPQGPLCTMAITALPNTLQRSTDDSRPLFRDAELRYMVPDAN